MLYLVPVYVPRTSASETRVIEVALLTDLITPLPFAVPKVITKPGTTPLPCVQVVPFPVTVTPLTEVIVPVEYIESELPWKTCFLTYDLVWKYL